MGHTDFKKKQMLSDEGKGVLGVALINKEHAEPSSLREDHDGVSDIIKGSQISVKDKSTFSESI